VQRPDGRLLPIDHGADLGGADRAAELHARVDELRHQMQALGMDPEADARHVNAGLADIEQRIGRQLTTQERADLHAMATQNRGPDGLPDVEVMHQAIDAKQTLQELAPTDEQRAALLEHAARHPGEGGVLDLHAAHEALNAPQPVQRPADDADPATWNQYVADRWAEVERAQAQQRDQEASDRAELIADGISPGKPSRNLRPWEVEGRAPNIDDPAERDAVMVDQLQALNAADDAAKNAA
jgi:hypothetical protein